MKLVRKLRNPLFVLLLTLAAVALHGYHYGVQDQFVYLSAIKHDLDPSLYPHDAEFFTLQTRLTLFDELVAWSIRATGLRVDRAVFLWHLLSIYLLLLGCWRVARRCFGDPAAQWAATVLAAVMLLLAIGGALVFLADPYLSPRTLATAALLFAVASVLDRSWWALAWIVLAAAMHPTLAAAGAFHLMILAWRPRMAGVMAAVLPLTFLGAVSEAWREALATRWFLFPLRWPWYAWFGVVVPLALLAWFGRLGARLGLANVAHLSRRLLWSGSAGVALAVVITVTPGLERLIPAEPMRVLHLLTLLTVLLAGGLLGQYILRRSVLRWGLLFVPLCVVMFVAQRQLYSGSAHIEWPGRAASNAWVEAFDWVRANTPRDALFALDPRHQERPGQDFHSFRALAERSMLADYSKDRGVAATWPELALVWREQVRAREGWAKFGAADFQRLKQSFIVTWVLVESPAMPGLECPFQNAAVSVCRIP